MLGWGSLPGKLFRTVWCGREDSNFHGLSPTTTSTLRVYQFRHDRIREKATGRNVPRRPGKARPLAKRSGPRNGFAHVPLRDSGKRAVYHEECRAYQAAMAFAFIALAALAQAASRPVATRMPATATVRILAGARVHLGPSSRPLMVKAAVRTEDGQRRPALLIEFE